MKSAGVAPAWQVVAARESRDLWWGGRGPTMMLGLSLLLSVTTYLVASNQALNFLEQRESVSLTLQVAIAVSGLLSLLTAADAVSGERERDTLECLLLAPVSRRALVGGKGSAALSVWATSYAVSVPYLTYLSGGVDVLSSALLVGLVVGLLLAVGLVGFGLVVSCFARSNRWSLAVTLFALLALYAPTQMPTSARNGWFGELLLRVDPFTAALTFVSKVVVDGRSMTDVGDWLLGPLAAAVLACGATYVVAARLSLGAGEPG